MANEALGDLVRKQQALDAIDKFADKYCKVVTAEGSSSSSDASSKTDASANGVARFMLSIGSKRQQNTSLTIIICVTVRMC